MMIYKRTIHWSSFFSYYLTNIIIKLIKNIKNNYKF